MRDASVHELQRRFMIDVPQAERVGSLADTLYGMVQARPTAELSKDERRELRRELAWAAALHEMGMMVSHHDHHRHSAYVLAHVDAAGFSQSQQRRLAELVLAQRGSLRKSETALEREPFAWQVLCLRLAIIKCHARRPVDLGALKLRGMAGQARLGFAPGWVERNPRTLYLLNEEVAAWQRNGSLRLSLDA
jgi:exopolyphosphatase/guanosine-5'-triphosphate,3'-diphosphate pyrophosphatase